MGFNFKLLFAIAVSLLLSWQLADTVSTRQDDVPTDGTANDTLQGKANETFLHAQLSRQKSYANKLPLADNTINVGYKVLGENLRRDDKKREWILMPWLGSFSFHKKRKNTLIPDKKILNTDKLVSNMEKNYKSDTIPNTDVNDDVFISTMTQYSSINRVFYPVDDIWRHSKCKSLNLNLTNINTINAITAKALSIPSVIKNIVGDGNCLYRALSYWITGREDDHWSIRQLVCKIIKSDEKIAKYFGGKKKLRKYLKHNPIERYGVWGTDVEIFGAAILLKTPIYVYGTNVNEWQLFNTNISFENPLSTSNRCLYIRNINNSHYDVVINVK